MTHNRIIALLMVILIAAIVVPFTGCDSSGASPTETIQDGSPQPTSPPIGTHLVISSPPRLGEKTDLAFTIEVTNAAIGLYGEQSLADARAWVAFSWANTQGSYSEARQSVPVPVEEVLTDGGTTWEGNALQNTTIKLHSTIHFAREGIWTIEGFFSGEGWEKPQESLIEIAVSKDAAANVNAKDFKSGPLAHLGNFRYGASGVPVPNQFHPLGVELDISKAPRVGEEALLSCRVSSPLLDAPDFSARISFLRRLEDNSVVRVLGDSLLVDGNLGWEGDLKQGETVRFSASIKFPEEGDWEVYAEGNFQTNDQVPSADSMKVNITRDRSSFGWEERQTKTPSNESEWPPPVDPFSEARPSIVTEWGRPKESTETGQQSPLPLPAADQPALPVDSNTLNLENAQGILPEEEMPDVPPVEAWLPPGPSPSPVHIQTVEDLISITSMSSDDHEDEKDPSTTSSASTEETQTTEEEVPDVPPAKEPPPGPSPSPVHIQTVEDLDFYQKHALR